MKRTLMLLGLGLMLSAPVAFAQKPMDQANEKAVQITQGPSITNISGNSATINWTTNSSGANRVRYRVAGSNSAWKTATHPGGGTSHSLQLTGLEPGKTYEWQILTTDGDLWAVPVGRDRQWHRAGRECFLFRGSCNTGGRFRRYGQWHESGFVSLRQHHQCQSPVFHHGQ
jgi:hypothetical protein